MTEQQTNEQQQSTETTETVTKEQHEALRKTIGKQVGEREARIEELEQALAQREQADAESVKQELAENNKHKELFEKSQTEWTEKFNTFEGQLNDKTNENANLHKQIDLLKAGVTDDEQSEFLIYKYNKLEDAGDFSEWLTAQNVVKNTGKSSGNVGKVSTASAQPVVIPTTYAEAQNMTKEQKAEARRAILENGHNGLIG